MPSKNRKVLIAEDNPGLARVLTFKFKSSGFDPTSCLNGGDAWAAFQKEDYAAVVSDHEMPVMSGTELIAQIRAMNPKLPCFLVTGRQLELSRDPIIVELCVQEVFAKPFSPAAVVSAVSAAIKEYDAQSNVNPDASIPALPGNLAIPTANTVGQTPGANV